MIRRALARTILVGLTLVSAAWVAPATVSAASVTFYVDGKTGSDADDGRTADRAFKTIARAAAALPAGSGAAGSRVVVKGYADYIYRERAIPSPWDRRGAEGSPIRFLASGYVAGSSAYVKPIVSGADPAPRPGQRWDRTATAGVWRTAWPTKPFGYGTYGGPLQTALFQDGMTWLWEQPTLSALAARASAGRGGYWWSAGYLYASAIGDKDPGSHAIEVIMRHTFYFEGQRGVRHVEVRGFEVRHSANGIAFAQGVDYAVAADNVVRGNLPMGIGVSGRRSGSTLDPAVGITIARNRGSYNTLQAVKLDVGTQRSQVCDNAFAHDGVQGIKVQGARDGAAADLLTSSVVICRNELFSHTLNPTGSPYNNANGITISNGARNVTVEDNRIHDNDVGIHVTQETTGRARMDGIVLRRNDIHGNRRFGIFFYDGANGTAAGSGSMRSDHDVVWDNGIGIQVGRGSTNKAIKHLTAHDNGGDGIRIGEGGLAAAGATVTDALSTANGGYGFQLVAGSRATISYTGLSGNALGATRGSATKVGLNTKAAGYVSTSPSSSDFLRLRTDSYQQSAGSDDGPVGARY